MAKLPPFSWDSEAGRIAKLRFLVWGARERELQATGGDPTALPRKSDVTQEGAGLRGKPGDLPSVLHEAMDVDMALMAWDDTNGVRKLLQFVYRDGYEEQIISIDWTLRSGEVINLPRSEPEPMAAESCAPITKRVQLYDLDEYDDPALDKLIESFYPRKGAQFKRYRRKFLHRVLFDFAEFLARRCGLGEYRRAA